MATCPMDLDIDMQEAPRSRGQHILDDFDRIRDNDPVFWSDASRCWIVTRHDDVADIFKGKFPLTNIGRTDAVFHTIAPEQWDARIPNLVKYSRLWITSTDGRQHMRLRTLMMKAMSRKVIETLRPYARARANELLDIAIAAPQIEFNERISRPMTGFVLFRMLGMPEERFSDLRDWSTWLVEGAASATPTPEQLERADFALVEMNKAVLIEIEKRKHEPKDDFITALMNAREGEDRLTTDEIFAQMHVAIVAGHDTTMNTLTLSVEALAHDPALWQRMYEDPDRMLDYVTELQRHVAMSGGQPRLVEADFELRGKQIRQGQMVIALIAGGNRDPEAFGCPTRIDPDRDNRHSLVFAPGVHFCLGHLLAKMQLTEFLGAMVEKASGVEVLDERLDFMPVWVFRGLYSLNVRFTARTALAGAA